MSKPSAEPKRRPIALVTGGSSGIGAALAERFATEGYDLVLVARDGAALEARAHELRTTTSALVVTIALDLAAEDAVATLLAQIDLLKLDVDVLVNNAGAAAAGRFCDHGPEIVAQIVRVNVGALTALTHAVLRRMLARGSGRLLNVASTAAFQPVPGLAAYAASKAYVLSFTEALAEELARTPITVTALCPGLTNTRLVRALGADEVPAFAMLAPAEVAREGFVACMRGDVICTPGIGNRLAAVWSQYQPRAWVRRTAGLVTRLAFDY